MSLFITDKTIIRLYDFFGVSAILTKSCDKTIITWFVWRHEVWNILIPSVFAPQRLLCLVDICAVIVLHKYKHSIWVYNINNGCTWYWQHYLWFVGLMWSLYNYVFGTDNINYEFVGLMWRCCFGPYTCYGDITML
jgi:hypothetical protein